MDPVRTHVVALLRGGQAFDRFEEIIAEFKPKQREIVPADAERNAWQIVEHLRISLRDILDFSQNENGKYQELDWPDEYWPKETNGDWEKSVRGYLDCRDEMIQLVKDSKRDLLAPFPWGDGQTLLREALLAADHEAYHLGQLVEMKRWLEVRS